MSGTAPSRLHNKRRRRNSWAIEAEYGGSNLAPPPQQPVTLPTGGGVAVRREVEVKDEEMNDVEVGELADSAQYEDSETTVDSDDNDEVTFLAYRVYSGLKRTGKASPPDTRQALLFYSLENAREFSEAKGLTMEIIPPGTYRAWEQQHPENVYLQEGRYKGKSTKIIPHQYVVDVLYNSPLNRYPVWYTEAGGEADAESTDGESDGESGSGSEESELDGGSEGESDSASESETDGESAETEKGTQSTSTKAHLPTYHICASTGQVAKVLKIPHCKDCIQKIYPKMGYSAWRKKNTEEMNVFVAYGKWRGSNIESVRDSYLDRHIKHKSFFIVKEDPARGGA